MKPISSSYSVKKYRCLSAQDKAKNFSGCTLSHWNDDFSLFPHLLQILNLVENITCRVFINKEAIVAVSCWCPVCVSWFLLGFFQPGKCTFCIFIGSCFFFSRVSVLSMCQTVSWFPPNHTTTSVSLTGMLMTPVMIGTLRPSFRTYTYK